MKARRLIAVAAVALGATALVSASPAGATAAPPTISDSLVTYYADAYNIAATGPIHYAPHLHSVCNVGTSVNKTFSLSVPGIGSVSLPVSSCYVAPDDDFSANGSADVAGATLLGGRLAIGAVHSRCNADYFGNTTVGSTVVSINGRPIGNTPGALTIPGLATVYFNVNSSKTDPETRLTTLSTIGVLVVVPGHTYSLLGRTYTTPTQTITLSECSISGYELGEGGGGLG
jgi:hypothetical protein